MGLDLFLFGENLQPAFHRDENGSAFGRYGFVRIDPPPTGDPGEGTEFGGDFPAVWGRERFVIVSRSLPEEKFQAAQPTRAVIILRVVAHPVKEDFPGEFRVGGWWWGGRHGVLFLAERVDDFHSLDDLAVLHVLGVEDGAVR